MGKSAVWWDTTEKAELRDGLATASASDAWKGLTGPTGGATGTSPRQGRHQNSSHDSLCNFSRPNERHRPAPKRSEPRGTGRAFAVPLCAPPFPPELHLTPTAQHGAFQSSTLRQVNHRMGSAGGQSLSSLRHCLGWPRSLGCVRHRNQVVTGSSATCFGRDKLSQVPRSHIREQPARFYSSLGALMVAMPHTRASVQLR